jgi:hypothetical protein
MLAHVRTVTGAKELRDQAAAVEKYLRLKEGSFAAAQDAAEIKLWAERRLGELLAETVKKRGRNSSGVNTLPEGVTRTQSSRWQQVARLPLPDFEQHIADFRQRQKSLTTEGARKLAQQHQYQEDRRRAARRGRSAQLSDQVRVLHGDFRTLLADAQLFPSVSVPLFLADPPYDGASVSLYGDLARLAARILQPCGSLIVYTGKAYLPEVLALMTPHLRYWWTLAVDHPPPNVRVRGRRVFSAWKPLLWFVKDHLRLLKDHRGITEYLADKLRGDKPDKRLHVWAQGVGEAAYLIKHLTKPGELVVDPLCGSGTTLVAALRQGRRALGIDSVAKNVNISKSRLAGGPACGAA